MRINKPEGTRPEQEDFTQSFLYVWRIADFEARQVGAALIEPCHCLLSILKLVDIDLTSIDFGNVTLADNTALLANPSGKVIATAVQYSHMHADVIKSGSSTPAGTASVAGALYVCTSGTSSQQGIYFAGTDLAWVRCDFDS